ncbi:MAG: hypothetical protein AAGJ81_06680 [Verrucomicrobiota bacterium]
MAGDLGSDGSTEVIEVDTEDPDDVEAVGNDPGVREPFSDHGAVGAGEVDTDDPDALAPLERAQEGGKFLLAFAFSEIEDLIVFEVTEGGHEAAFTVEGVFVDAEDKWAVQIAALTGDSLGPLPEDSSGSGGTNE